MRRSVALLALTLAVVAIGLAVRTPAASTAGEQARQGTTAPQEDALPALLIEVRGLRAAMERIASAGPRVQLALGRVQLQEQRVTTLIRRLDEIRGPLLGAQSTYDRLQQESQRAELALREAHPGGPPLEELKAHQRNVRGEVTRAAAQLQRVTADEAGVAAELASEQARWTDLNQRLEALEAALGLR
jgi:chromosome segregation ATPase